MWFRALQRIDRVLVELTIRVACNVRSAILTQRILAVTRKLQELENTFQLSIREIGFPLAQKVSIFAQNWGNQGAKNWANDGVFAGYLTMMQLDRTQM